MTGDKMNVFLSKKTFLTVSVGLFLPMALSVGGCAGAFDARTQAESPLAPRVQALVESHNRYPRWADFPQATTDTPPPAYVAAQVQTLANKNQSLATQIASIDWSLNPDPAVLENMIRQKLDPRAMAPIGPQSPAEVEAFADSLRRKATPPPPIDRPR